MRKKSDGHFPLSEHERAVWSAVKKLGEHALARVGTEIERATGLSGSDFGILSRLEDLGGGVLAQRELGLSLDWQKSRLSHHLTRMETRELVRRDPSDTSRGVLISITALGRNRIDAARPVHAEAIRKQVLQHLDINDQHVLLKIAKSLSEE